MNFARIQVLIVGLVFLACPCVMLARSFDSQERQARMAATLQPVPAVVVSSKVEKHQVDVPASGKSTQSAQQTLYAASVQFNYDFNGKTYVGDHWGIGRNLNSARESVEANLDQVKAGQKITAWISPANPAMAYLTKAVDFAPFGMCMLLSMFSFIGGLIICMSFVRPDYRVGTNPAIEVLFDVPCLVWLLFAGYELYRYYSTALTPYSVWSYVAAGIALVATAIIIYVRLAGHGLVPPLSRWRKDLSQR